MPESVAREQPLNIGICMQSKHTLMASVQMAAMTSNEPFNTWLSNSEGSYSQMAVVVSTAAILVIRAITLTFPRLMT